MAKTDQKINPQFPDDESLQSWARNQLWVIKNTPVASNDTVPMPAARIGYALQRLEELLGEKIVATPAKVEFESRGNVTAKEVKTRSDKETKELGKSFGKLQKTLIKPLAKSATKISKKYGVAPAMDATKQVEKAGKAKIALSPTEKKTLSAIEQLINDGIVPTYRGIAMAMGKKGHAGVHETVERLASYGKVVLVGKAGRQKIGLPE